ncbi:NAD(P)/FAD-dependent oxidoreductase [Nocardioides kongjuensis]|uniref:NADPH-dependent 2,4-dienoyl-CoA reductase/sulfur reductase-like enzyme n=1 Tax=Nocardioides kongjuensis TaxID=349522 RepID=A0A852RSS3_9ACTN|nr:FAD-dependent oxidoreductase [Nocardioides kongjuensis]NYD32266.1 NADPH-dependent 2,4-dienoyl-CoA reductase/sulfur reductase-like enzyme [Nocardioides kongjuensis]
MNVVVIGGGLAAASAAAELREQGHTGDIVVVGGEPHPPYERPPLSKGLLLGSSQPQEASVHPPEWYDEHQVDLRTGTVATGLDLDRRRVRLESGELPYDRLLLATGATPRHLPMADASRAPVVHLRTLDDALALRERLTEGARIAIIGAGWIGLEVASAARQRGASVTVLESAPLPLQRVLGDEVATVFADLHREHGVDLRLGAQVVGIEDEHGEAVVHVEGSGPVVADLLLVAVGVSPTDELAARAGLAVDNGVLVDAWLRTPDPHVLAAGDVANHDHPTLGTHVRVEHWDTAIHHGRHAARVMLGSDEPYTRLPYFFTDQYDLGMEYVGHVAGGAGHDLVVRGDLAGRQASVLWLQEDRVVAGMHLNDWDAIGPLRAVVGRQVTDAVRDPAVPLADLV